MTVSSGQRKLQHYLLLRHLVLWHSSQEIAPAEWRDALGELVVVKGDAVVPHHDAARASTQDDDLQLHS